VPPLATEGSLVRPTHYRSFLIVGLICNALVRPVDANGIGRGGLDARSGLAWLAVGVPLAWGVWITLQNAVKLFA